MTTSQAHTTELDSSIEFEEDTIPTVNNSSFDTSSSSHTNKTDTRYSTNEDHEDGPPSCGSTGSECSKVNAFRIADKKYKMIRTSTWQRKIIPTDFSDVVDLRNVSLNTEENVSKVIKVATMGSNGKYEFHVSSNFLADWKFPVAPPMSTLVSTSGPAPLTLNENENQSASIIASVLTPTSNTLDSLDTIDKSKLTPQEIGAFYKRRKQQSQHERRQLLRRSVRGYQPDLSGISGGTSSEVYAISQYPGFYVISRALRFRTQLLWALRCFILYPEYTNLTYLHGPREEDRELFLKACVEWKRKVADNEGELDRARLHSSLKKQNQPQKQPEQDKITSSSSSSSLSSECSKTATHEEKLAFEPLLKKLFTMRWSSLGFIYDWTKREYHEGFTLPFPQPLATLTRRLLYPLQLAGFVSSAAETRTETTDKSNQDTVGHWSSWFRAEAGIVNYYPLHSSMGAHIDDAEPAVNRPIVSFSVGCSAVFLVGSASRADPPVAVFLRSGDAIIQEGPSRLSFHAVPRIVENSCPTLAFHEALEEVLLELETDEISTTTPPQSVTVGEVLPLRTPAAFDVISDEDKKNTSAMTPPEVDLLEAGTKYDRDEKSKDLQQLALSLSPYLAKYDLSFRDILEFTVMVLGESRLNFNVRQVIDEANSRPSEVREKRPIAAVLEGLHTKVQPREQS